LLIHPPADVSLIVEQLRGRLKPSVSGYVGDWEKARSVGSAGPSEYFFRGVC